MTVLQDIRGNPLTGADHLAAAAYMEGLGQLNLLIGDPVASAQAATEAAPTFVMGMRCERGCSYSALRLPLRFQRASPGRRPGRCR